jgi:hypothetical protein
LYDNTELYVKLNTPTYYVNHLPYNDNYLGDNSRDSEEIHNLDILETDSQAAKAEKLKNFLDYKSFIELGELNILDQSKGFVNVFSDNDLIGYQLSDYDYATKNI